MSKNFKVTKRVSLAQLGEGWDQCFLELRAMSYNDLKQLETMTPGEEADDEQSVESIERIYSVLEDKFIAGKALTDDGPVDIEAGDIRDLPVEIAPLVMREILGTPDPK